MAPIAASTSSLSAAHLAHGFGQLARYLGWVLLATGVLLSYSAAAEATAKQRLGLTARVWGLVKHRHPAVTARERSWHQILVDQLPRIEATGGGPCRNPARTSNPATGLTSA